MNRTLNVFLIALIDLKVDDRILSKGCNIFDIPFSRNPANPRNVKAFRDEENIEGRRLV